MIASRIIPLFLLILVVTQLVIGGNSLPNWLGTLSIKFDQDPLLLLRALVIIEVLLALLGLTARRGAAAIAWTALVGTGFSTLAGCSAAFARERPEELIGNGLVLLLTIGLGVALAGSSKASKGDETGTDARQGLSGSLRWTVFAAAAFVGASLVLNLPVSERTIAEGRPLKTTGPAVAGDVSIFTLTPDSWEGLRVEEIELTTYVPELSRLTAEGTSTVVLYNKGCGDCHELFEVHFSEGYDHQVIAIEVPPAENAELAPGYRSDDVACPDCIRTSLPAGPLWLVTPPVAMVVEDGLITCCNPGRNLSCLD